MKDIGYGKGYAYDHDTEEGFSGAELLARGDGAADFLHARPTAGSRSASPSAWHGGTNCGRRAASDRRDHDTQPFSPFCRHRLVRRGAASVTVASPSRSARVAFLRPYWCGPATAGRAAKSCTGCCTTCLRIHWSGWIWANRCRSRIAAPFFPAGTKAPPMPARCGRWSSGSVRTTRIFRYPALSIMLIWHRITGVTVAARAAPSACPEHPGDAAAFG